MAREHGVGDREHHRTGAQPDGAERKQASEHVREDQQETKGLFRQYELS